MNSIVLWVGGLAALAIGVMCGEPIWDAPLVSSGYVLLVLAASVSFGGHNDE